MPLALVQCGFARRQPIAGCSDGFGKKKRSFYFCSRMGFREIEVGFPAASDTEYQFVRTLIEHNLIPPQVMIQVLTPAREPIIRRTMQSLSGCKQAIVHLYNPTSRAQREQVFEKIRRKKSSKLLFRQFELSKSVQQKSREDPAGIHAGKLYCH